MLLSAEKNLAICQYLGCPALIVHPIVMDDREKREKLNLAMYRKLIPAAKKYGVKICLENLMGLFRGRPTQGVCSTTEEACMYIDALNSETGYSGALSFEAFNGVGHLMPKEVKPEVLTLLAAIGKYMRKKITE